MSTAMTQLMTAEELLRRPDLGRCELIYGELVMMSPAGAEHGVVAMRIGRFLSAYVDDNNLGASPAAETGYKLASDPDLVRAPDASFVRRARLIGGVPTGFIEGAPDVAVEVVSPGDTRRDVAEKVNTWLAHGTTSVWVADPATRTLTIYRTGQQPIRLTATDELRDDPALPGFVLPLTKVFRRS